MSNLSAILGSLGGRGDAASATGSAQAKLAFLRPQAATYHATASNAGIAESTVILDTGQLVAGEYEVVVWFSHKPIGTSVLEAVTLQHRDAANTGNTRSIRMMSGMNWDSGTGVGGPSGGFRWPRVPVATNERFRLIKTNGADAGSPSQEHMMFVRPV